MAKKKSTKKLSANEQATLDIMKALEKLNNVSNSYKPTPIKQADYSSIYKTLSSRPRLTPIDWSGYGEAARTPIKQKPKSSGHSIPKPDLWGMLSGTLGLPGGIITDTASSVIKDIKNFDLSHPIRDGLNLIGDANPTNAIARGLVNGGKTQWKDWHDGKWTWGDVPGVGLLHGMDKGFKRGEDIMKQFNVKNRWGTVGGGLAIDVALDPLTYLTGGASMAGKLSKAKEIEKMAQIQKAMKLEGKFKNTSELTDAARSSLKKKYPNMSDHIIEKRVKNIANDIKTARNAVHDANINKWGVSIPFTNKMTAALGNISKKAATYTTEAKLGDFHHVADNLIQQASRTPEQAKKILAAVKKLYKVPDLQSMTKTHLDDLTSRLTPIIEQMGKKKLADAKVLEEMRVKSMPNEIFNIATKKGIPNESVAYTKTSIDDILKSIDPVVAKKLEPMLRGMGDVNDIRKLAPDAAKMFGEFAPKLMKTVKGKTAAEVEKAYSQAAEQLGKVSHTATITKDAPIQHKVLERMVEILKDGHPASIAMKDNRSISKAFENPFNELMNGKTNFEHWLDKKNPFDSRTLKTGNKYVDSMANHLADMNSQKIGEFAKHQSDLGAIAKYIKKNKLSQDDMMKAIYHLEGQAPKALGNFTPSAHQKALADLIKPFLGTMAADEKAAGVLSKTRKNYFPHMLKKDAAELKKIQEFKDKHGDLNGLNQVNKNDKSRTSFDTIAERDDYLAKLEKQIQKETDPAMKEQLIEQQQHVADLFDTDIVSALTRRVREGIRSKAMKEMQGKLSKFGMMKTNPKGAEELKGLKKLDPAEAKKFGLGEGQHYMHPDVFEGLKRVDEIFTNEGMNKMLRHLNAVTDIFRTGVTTMKLSHYRNNVIGNVINNMAAGVHMNDYKMAQKLMKGYRKGKLSPAQMKLMETAFKHNVLSGGFTHDMLNLDFKDPTKLEKIAHMIGDNKVVKGVRQKGEKIDDVFRLANFLNGMDKFGNVEKGAAQVRKYLFNYNEMTNMDRNMRVIIPFWNWTKRNIPLQVNLLLENPKVAMNVERFKELFNKDENGADWQKDMGIKIPGTNYYTSLPSPTEDLNTLLNPMSLIGSMAPVPKIALETYMNKQFFTGKPITYGQNSVDPADLPGYLSKQFGVTGNIYDAVSGKRSPGEALVNYLNPIYGIPANAK